MARGWESKAVEEQQSQFENFNGNKNTLSRLEIKKKMERKRLLLARANVSNQIKLATNPRYVAMLTGELEELERQLARLS